MRAVGAALVASAVMVAATGCGGTSTPSGTTSGAAVQWRTGLTQWSKQMLGTLDQISVLFGSPVAVEQLTAANARTDATLARYESTLDSCTATVNGLGPPPSVYSEAQSDALAACGSLESGAREVRSGIHNLQGGLGDTALDGSSSPLSTGQQEVVAARQDLIVVT